MENSKILESKYPSIKTDTFLNEDFAQCKISNSKFINLL